MSDDNKNDLPKPQFSEVGRMYQAVVAAGISAGSLNRDRADTVVRDLAKTTWLKDNMDIYRMWNAGGDVWGQLIKDVKSYSRDVAQHKRKKKPAEG
jgi:hypothetical protein